MNDEPIKRRDEAFSKTREEIQNLDSSVVDSENASYSYRHLDRKEEMKRKTTLNTSNNTETIVSSDDNSEDETILKKFKSVRRNKAQTFLAILCSAVIIAITVLLVIFVFL